MSIAVLTKPGSDSVGLLNMSIAVLTRVCLFPNLSTFRPHTPLISLLFAPQTPSQLLLLHHPLHRINNYTNADPNNDQRPKRIHCYRQVNQASFLAPTCLINPLSSNLSSISSTSLISHPYGLHPLPRHHSTLLNSTEARN